MEVQPAPTVDTGVAAATTTPTASTSTSPAPQGVQGAVAPQETANDRSGITPAIAKLFGAGAPQPIQLNVSYRVEGSDVVTVFSDPKTGKEIAQFPPELLLGLAKFFDQQAGITFDKNA